MTTTDSISAWLPLPVGLAPGFMVGPWRIEHELGSGGMGVVYAAVHELIGKRVAIKILQRRASSPGGERFLVEAKAVNAIGHPNIVDIFETGELEDGRPYFVMERLAGQTLGERAAAGQLSPIEAIDYLLPLCDALAAAHAAGIVHRDIKLDNVFLVDTARGPFVKLLDWGIASVANADGTHDRTELVGTPRYLAPEQACGEAATRCGDVYSLGVLAYELFCEEPPFVAPSPVALLLKHVNEAPPSPRLLWAQMPQALEDLLLDMLEKTPSDRPTVVQVAQRLRDVRVELTGEPMRTTSPSMQRLVPRTIGHSETLLAPTPNPSISMFAPRPSRRAWVGAFALVGFMIGARFLLDGDAARALTASVPSVSASTMAAEPLPAMTGPEQGAVAAADVRDEAAAVVVEDDGEGAVSDVPTAGVATAAAAEQGVAGVASEGERMPRVRRSATSARSVITVATPRSTPRQARRLHRDAVIEAY